MYNSVYTLYLSRPTPYGSCHSAYEIHPYRHPISAVHTSSPHLSVEHTTLSPSSCPSSTLPYDICFFNVFFSFSFFLFAVDFFAFDDRRSTCGKRLKRTFRRKRCDFIFFFFMPKTERLFSFDTIESISYLHTVGVERTFVIQFGGRREQCV